MNSKINLFLTALLFSTHIGFSQNVVVSEYSPMMSYFGEKCKFFDDTLGKLTIQDILKRSDFKESDVNVPNLGVSTYTHWIQFDIENNTNDYGLVLDINQPSLDDVTLFIVSNSNIIEKHIDDETPIQNREIKFQNYSFKIPIKSHDFARIYLKVKSGDQVLLPLRLGTNSAIAEKHQNKDLWFGIYAGVLAAMLLFNLFLYIRTKEKEYLSYVFYVVILFLTQANFQGYTLRFFWPSAPWVERYAVFILSSLVGIVGSTFFIKYIQVKKYLPKSLKYFYSIFALYTLIVVLALIGKFNIAYNLLQPTASSAAIVVLVVSINIWRKGSKQAGNLLFAWTVFMLGIVIFVLKDFGILPTNEFTYNVMTIGSAIEGILLSFGLADKINQLKLEKEQSDAERIKMIQSQNEFLEVKVHERTAELEDAKERIQSQYDHLRMTQKQLVESEKLAGLGQMTAGIAHELNNPINFVTSNVGPLHRDIEDVVGLLNEYYQLPDEPTAEQINDLKTKYKKTDIDFVQKEIHQLLQGIEEGSKRTAEIVRGLRIFARADKDTLVPANINECLQSTLVVMKSVTKGNVNLTKEIDPAMPFIECFPGKLNQVIANLIANAVQATKMPGRSTLDRQVFVKSWHDEKYVHVSVKDNGCGIEDAAKEKIFVPFYTTKSVGEGTGLGLSIAMGIVEEHNGEIEVISTPGEGSEFIVHLPRARKGVSLSAA